MSSTFHFLGGAIGDPVSLFRLSMFSTGAGIGRSLTEEICDNSAGDFVLINSCLSFTFSWFSSILALTISCCSFIDLGRVP